MAMELKHLNPQHVMDVTGKAIDEISRLRAENAELKAENERLNNALDKERSETIKYMDELCNAKNEIERLTIDKRNDELRADVADGTVEKLKAENAELKRKLQDQCISCPVKMQEDDVVAELKQNLEDAKATAYAESVDAGMRERRLRRALYKACANWADAVAFEETEGIGHDNSVAEKWRKMESMCLKKVDEYK